MAETFVPFEFARRIYAAARRRADAFRIADWRLCDPIVGEIVLCVCVFVCSTWNANTRSVLFLYAFFHSADVLV